MSLPADLSVALFNQVVERIRATPTPARVSESQQGVQQQFGAVWIADGSSLERLQRHLGQLQAAPKNPLTGKVMMVVEAFTHRPAAAWYAEEAQCHETTWSNCWQCCPWVACW